MKQDRFETGFRITVKFFWSPPEAVSTDCSEGLFLQHTSQGIFFEKEQHFKTWHTKYIQIRERTWLIVKSSASGFGDQSSYPGKGFSLKLSKISEMFSPAVVAWSVEASN